MFQSGARVIIHNQTRHARPSSEGVDLSTNYQTNLGITRSFLSKLGYPYSDCVKNVDSIDSHPSFYYKSMFSELNITKYNQKECLELCQQTFIKMTCRCLDASLPIIYTNNEEPICTSLDSIKCIKSAQTNFSKITNKCVDCPLECDSVSYNVQTSRSRYPTSYYTAYLQIPYGYSQSISERNCYK